MQIEPSQLSIEYAGPVLWGFELWELGIGLVLVTLIIAAGLGVAASRGDDAG